MENYEDILNQFEKIKKDAGIEPEEDYTNELEEMLGISIDDLDKEIQHLYKTKTIKIKKVHPDAVMPSYAYPTDSGFDLYSVVDIVLPPFGRALVPTGISVQFDENYEIQVRPKSGLAIKQGLTVLNTPGTVDQGYTGEIQVIVFNTNNQNVEINKGMKIAQAVLCPVINGKYINFQEVSDIEKMDRGNNGFGSTGI